MSEKKNTRILISLPSDTVQTLDDIKGHFTRSGLIRYILNHALKMRPGPCTIWYHCAKCGAPVHPIMTMPDRVNLEFECEKCGHIGEPALNIDSETSQAKREAARLRAALAALLVAHQIAGNGKTKEEAEAAANQQIQRIISGKK